VKQLPASKSRKAQASPACPWRFWRVLKNEKVHLPWADTFHAIGARLLREYAREIGLNDRSDSADLMDLVRHDLGQSKKDSRLCKIAHPDRDLSCPKRKAPAEGWGAQGAGALIVETKTHPVTAGIMKTRELVPCPTN
jgi:hypothetical protein